MDTRLQQRQNFELLSFIHYATPQPIMPNVTLKCQSSVSKRNERQLLRVAPNPGTRTLQSEQEETVEQQICQQELVSQ